MQKILLIFRIILSIQKTIYFNFKTFSLSTALLLPVYIDLNVRIKKTYKGAVILKCDKIKPFMVKIGIGGTSAINSRKGMFFMNKNNNSKVIFKENAKFSKGIVLYNNGGTTVFGRNFSCNKNCFIACDSNIAFGDDALLGWNINIRDSDGHKIIYSEKKGKKHNIIIGNHVWICSYVDILKGTTIGSDCVIGYKSLVTGLNCSSNCLIAGFPAKVIKKDVNWVK